MAGTSFFQILIKIAKQGGGDDEAIKGLYRLKSTVGSMIGVFGAVTGVAYTLNKAYKEIAGTTIDYANSVREVMNATGLQSEEASRLIQFTEDLGVTTESLIKAMIKLGKMGIDPTVENLAKMSDAYLALAPGTERITFLTENFGKSGTDLARTMELGSDAIRERNDAINGALVLDQQAIDMVELNKVALNDLNDAWDEFKIILGVGVIPEVTRFIEMGADLVSALFDQDGALNTLGETLYEFGTKRVEAAREASIEAANALRDHAEALLGAVEPTEALAQAQEDLTTEMDILKAAMSGDLQEAYGDYSEKMGDLTKEHDELTASLQQLTDWGYGPTSEKVKDLNEKLAENEQKQKDVAKATELATAKMIYQNVAAKLDAKSQLELARSLGLISERDYAVASALDALTQKYDANRDGVVDAAEGVEQYIRDVQELTKKINNLPDDQVINIATNYISTGTPPTPPPPCFLAGTKIATPEGERAIEEMQVGDQVWSREPDGQLIETTVARVFRHGRALSSCHYVINGRVRVTGNHPLHVNNGWMEARNICRGDLLTTITGQEQVTSFEMIAGEVETWNLEIGHACHNYFAEGVLAHNKETEESGYAGGGVAYGPRAGHWELLHGTEAVIPLKGGAVPVTLQGGGGESISFAGATFNITLSGGASMGDFMQSLMDAAGK